MSPWNGGIFITCAALALSGRTDGLSEGCLSCGVLDINMWKICFFFVLNQYKDIWPLHNVTALQQKFFILLLFRKMSFKAIEEGLWGPTYCLLPPVHSAVKTAFYESLGSDRTDIVYLLYLQTLWPYSFSSIIAPDACGPPLSFPVWASGSIPNLWSLLGAIKINL